MNILILDIETYPNNVAVFSLKNTYIHPKYIVSHGYVLCFTGKWLGKSKKIFAKSPDGHLKMLKMVHELLVTCDAVVHYNGRKFDIPTLNAEFLLHGMSPIPDLVQIDLYPLIRRTFNFPSYKLDYVCDRLGIGTKVRHDGWDMWKQCHDAAHKSHAKAWRSMEKYNKGDIVLTEALYKRVREWFPTTHGYKRIHEYLEGKRERP